MRRRASAIAAVVVASALLSGCVGIPSTGGVVSGPTIDAEDLPDFIALPSGPVAGASQEEILEGFFQAANSPREDYQIARLYLAGPLKQDWDPDVEALVRTGAGATTRNSDTSLTYSTSVVARVDVSGQYSQFATPTPQARDFEFVQEDGEWRISSAPDGVIFSQNSFSSVFDEHSLYYYDPTYRYLVPDVRWFPTRATVSSRIVRALLEGPSTLLAGGAVLTEFPEATTVGPGDVTIDAGTATVDLSAEARSANPVTRERMRQQLVATLGSVSTNISNVVITVGGVELSVPSAPGGAAIVNPAVESSALIGTGESFGYGTSSELSTIPGITERVVEAQASAVTLSSDKTAAAVLDAQGRVLVVRSSTADPVVVDARPGLVAPAIDPLGFTWSAQSQSAAGITAFEFDGTPHPVASTIPADTRLTSFDISRDGTRVVMALDSSTGRRLVVAGIIRDDNVPVRLGELVELAVESATIVDSTWVDSRTVAIITRSGDTTEVEAFELGGPSIALGAAPGATTIAGGNAGIDGIRVLADGRLLRPQGSGGWQPTGVEALLLATQQ